jgi:ketosteroid isomerase-like protein
MSVGLKPTIRNMYADGDTVVVFIDAAGTAKDGKPYNNTYAWFLDLQDGKSVQSLRMRWPAVPSFQVSPRWR